jgi:membrane fusion protein (multidrug efflux system)
MKPSRVILLLLVTAVACAAGGFWFGMRRHAINLVDRDDTTTQPAEEDKPVARVTVAPIKKASITETVTAYGSVVAPPGDVRIVSVPFESRVGRVLVTAGQHVDGGADIVQLEASPDALNGLAEAKNALAAAEKDLKQTEQRFADHLATNSELSLAQQTLQSTKLKLDSLSQRGVGTSQTLKAEAAGIVGKVDVQEGQIVPAGGPLVEIASGKSIEVDLGVLPGDVPYLKIGQPVDLTPVDGKTEEPLRGKIRTIGQRVDPATRLVSVMITLPPDAHLMLDSYAVGKLVKASAEGLIVPASAVLPAEGGGFTVYTVRDGRAAKRTPHIGLQNDRDVQLTGGDLKEGDLKEGDLVVVTGNYELEDGMAVTTQAAAADSTQPGAIEAAPQPAPPESAPAQAAPATSAPASAAATEAAK